MSEPREVLVFRPGKSEILRSDYPWLVAVRMIAQGGRGGSSSDGNPGTPGTMESRVMAASDLPERMSVVCGKGGRGSGGEPGEDGYVIIEMYDEEIQP